MTTRRSDVEQERYRPDTSINKNSTDSDTDTNSDTEQGGHKSAPIRHCCVGHSHSGQGSKIGDEADLLFWWRKIQWVSLKEAGHTPAVRSYKRVHWKTTVQLKEQKWVSLVSFLLFLLTIAITQFKVQGGDHGGNQSITIQNSVKAPISLTC